MEEVQSIDGGNGREEIAQFMLTHEDALRRRIGAEVGKSPGVDADDVFSTTLRRVDYAAAHGSFQMRFSPRASIRGARSSGMSANCDRPRSW